MLLLDTGDMARKFIQMGVTRSRRYANHKGGRKYADRARKEALPKAEIEDKDKAEAARLFGLVLTKVKADPAYQALAQQHFEKYNHVPIQCAGSEKPPETVKSERLHLSRRAKEAAPS